MKIEDRNGPQKLDSGLVADLGDTRMFEEAFELVALDDEERTIPLDFEALEIEEGPGRRIRLPSPHLLRGRHRLVIKKGSAGSVSLPLCHSNASAERAGLFGRDGTFLERDYESEFKIAAPSLPTYTGLHFGHMEIEKGDDGRSFLTLLWTGAEGKDYEVESRDGRRSQWGVAAGDIKHSNGFYEARIPMAGRGEGRFFRIREFER